MKPTNSRALIHPNTRWSHYSGEALIDLVSTPHDVRMTDVVGTPRCVIGVATDGKHVVSIGAIDNLLKGAASQAVQNLNLQLGFGETLGLA